MKTLKTPILLLSLFGTALLLGFSDTTSQGRTSESLFGPSAANGHFGVKGVRAEYRDLRGNWPHTWNETAWRYGWMPPGAGRTPA